MRAWLRSKLLFPNWKIKIGGKTYRRRGAKIADFTRIPEYLGMTTASIGGNDIRRHGFSSTVESMVIKINGRKHTIQGSGNYIYYSIDCFGTLDPRSGAILLNKLIVMVGTDDNLIVMQHNGFWRSILCRIL